MPKITKSRIEFLPEDRNAVSEQSPALDIDGLYSIFNNVINNGDTTKWFKLLEEIAEKDADVIHALETRTSKIISKEWTIEGEDEQKAEEIKKALKKIKGDPSEGLLSIDQLLNSMLGVSYLVGLSISEIVTDTKEIIGFNHIPSHFLTFREAVFYPKLWTKDSPTGEKLNKEKMISHYLSSGKDPARGYLGLAIAIIYAFKRMNTQDKMEYSNKYGKDFLLVTMPSGDSYLEAWKQGAELIENLSTVDGVLFPEGVKVESVKPSNLDGTYFFNNEDDLRDCIVKIILGQNSTSDSENSNRSTADVHSEILDARILEDINLLEDTLTNQLVSKIKELLSISEDDEYRFKFVVGELEATLDEDVEEEVVEDEEVTNTQTTSETVETQEIEGQE